MAEFPALPLWTDAYLADCDHLTEVEHGRYLLLLMHMWRAPNRRFPNDDQWLARKFRRPVEAVQSELRPLLAEFFKSDGNWLYHKRLEREWERLSEMSRKQSERAKSRWEKGKAPSRGNAKRGTATTTSTQDTDSSLRSESVRTAQRGQSATRIPDDWTLTPELIAFGREKGFDDGRIRDMAAAFVDHWRSSNQPTARKRDWVAAFREWVRRERPPSQLPAASAFNGSPRGHGALGQTGRTAAAAAVVHARQQRADRDQF